MDYSNTEPFDDTHQDSLISTIWGNRTFKSIAVGVGFGLAAYVILNYIERQQSEDLKLDKPKDPPAMSKVKIVIDPWGDGVSDNAGKTGACLRVLPPYWIIGDRANLEVAFALRKYLVRAGASVTMTREGNQRMDMADRVKTIVKVRPDIYVAIRHGMYTVSRECPQGATGMGSVIYSSNSKESARFATHMLPYMKLAGAGGSVHEASVRRSFKADEYDGDGRLDIVNYFAMVDDASLGQPPLGLIIEPSPLCNCKWQSLYLAALHFGKDMDRTYLNVLGNSLANGIGEYLMLHSQ